MVDDPSSLTQVIEDEHRLDENPAHADVLRTTVAEVGVECLGAGRTEEHRPKDEEPFGIMYQKLQRIIGIESLENWQKVGDVTDS